MRRTVIKWGIGVIASAACASSIGGALQWSDNGHWYEAFLADSISWAQASAAATAKGGYLATLTTAAENQWVYDSIVAPTFGTGLNETDQAWLGGFKPVGASDPAVGWQWVTGEDWLYANWGAGEPNNVAGVENHLTINRFGDWTWNDEGSWPSGVKGYVVEYVPDGGFTILLLGVSLSALGVIRRWRT